MEQRRKRLTQGYRPDPLLPWALSWALSWSTSSDPRRATTGRPPACSTSTDQRPRTGRPSTLCTPRPWSRPALTEIYSRTAPTSTDSSTSHTPSTLLLHEDEVFRLANQLDTELSNPTPRETSRPATSPTLIMLWSITDSST